MRKVSIIGSVGIPAQYGGFETLVEHLTRLLGEDLEFCVFCSSKSYKNKIASYNNASLFYLPLNANGVQSILYDIISIFIAVMKKQTILVLGVSGCIVLPFVKFISKNKIIVNIDGMEWKRAKWGFLAKKFLKFSEFMAVKYSDIVIGDNECIVEYINSEYGVRAMMIPYGGDHVGRIERSLCELPEYKWFDGKYAFTVCRIEPENNIEMILSAFSQLTNDLVVVGNWNSSEYGIGLREKFRNSLNLHLLDPIYDQYKLNQLRSNCNFYIHGHSAGGTNPSLVEAMCLGLTIFAFDVNYNRSTTCNRARYFSDAESLKELIKSITDDESKKISQWMSRLAKEHYTWAVVARKYCSLI